MKPITQFVSELGQLKVRLFEEDGQLRYQAPKGVLSAEHLAEMRTRKTELLEFCRQAKAGAEELPLRPVPRDGELPIALAQQRLWLLDQIEGPSAAYNIALALRLRGSLDVMALQAALAAILQRQESLRTAFANHDGAARLVIAASVALPWTFTDLSGQPDALNEAKRQAQNEALRPFDLSQAPLARFRLWRLAAEDHVFLANMHHTVSDGGSIAVFCRELSAFYAEKIGGPDADLPALRIQYADFASSQRQWLDGRAFEPQVDYWRKQLQGLPPLLELPTDRPRPPQLSYGGASLRDTFDADLANRLRQLARQQETTLFVTLASLTAAFLARHTGRDDIPLACPASQRDRAELEPLIGFFINTLVLRIDLSGNPSFVELLARAKSVAAGGFANQSLPFDKLVDALAVERNPSYPPLAQFSLMLLDGGNQPPSLKGLQTEPFDFGNPIARYDLTLEIYDSGGAIDLFWLYNTGLFDEPTVMRMAGRLRNLAEAALARPSHPLARLPMLDESERQAVLYAFNATAADYPLNKTVVDAFEQQAANRPAAVAVVFAQRRIDYAELNRQANRLARHLRGLGVGPNERVAVCAGRGLDLVVGLLATLKAGGAYVPLDPSYPQQRLAYMLEDSAPVALLVDAGTKRMLAEATVHKIDLDADRALWAGQSEANLGRDGLRPNGLAYVIYTSGSTGRPKGVMVEHASLLNHIVWQSSTFHFTAEDAILQRTAISFDASVWEIWTPLAIGARLVLVPDADAKDPAAVAQIIAANRVTIAQFVPSFLQLLSQQQTGVLPCRYVFCGGEALPADLVERSRQVFAGELVNLYGPTEATIDATFWVCPSEGLLRRVPIGRPVANTQIYLLDAYGEPVPIGVVGEIHIGGAGVARGYLNRPELTAERFVADPFAAKPSARLYKTGDLGRWLADGTIEFLGRTDFQVKLRGFRIELGEIEDRLSRLATVEQAAVTVCETASGKSLVAYVAAGPDWDANAARDWLRQALPDYMLPHFFVALDRLPLTPNGKLDRQALPVPVPVRAEPSQGLPRNAAEQALAEIWAQLLGLKQVGIHDNFFALGGDSILSIQAASRAKQAGFSISPRQIFEHQTIATLAQAMPDPPPNSVEPRRLALPQLPQGHAATDDAEDFYPLTPLQQGLLFHSLHTPGAGLYCVQLSLRVHGLDAALFKQAWQQVLEHHPALRTAFFWKGLEQALQVVRRQATVRWDEHDWRGLGEAEQARQWQAVIEASQQQGFALDDAPLLRISLARVAEDSHRLLWSHHHLLLDGWSSSLVVKDLLAAYQALRRGETPVLAPARPYRDYLDWLSRQDTAQAEIFWRQTLKGQDAPTPLPLAPALPGQAVSAEHCAEQMLSLDTGLTEALQTLAKQCLTPLNTVVQAAFALLLSRYSGEDSVLFGVTTSGRPAELAGVETMVGLFINTLPLRVEVPTEAALNDWLKTVQRRQVDAQQHEYASLAQIQAWSGAGGGAALFDALYVFENYPLDEAVGDDSLRIDEVHSFDWTNYPLTLVAVPGASLRFLLQHDTRRFGEAAARRMLGHLRQLLIGMAADAGQPIRGLTLLTDEERRRAVIEWNDTARPYPRDSDIPALFDAAAAQTPAALAVAWGGQTLSYAQLQAQANQIAHYLNTFGVAAGSLVALHLQRSADMVALLLGILKAGAAYVPLDTAYPAERLALMLADSGAKLLLTERGLAATLDTGNVTTVFVDGLDAQIKNLPTTAPAVAITPQHLAYVIYTSGSTGTPKGVAVTHRAVIRLVKNTDFAPLGPADRVAQASNASFDAATFEIWGALLNSGTLVGVERDVVLSPWRLAAFLRDEQISTLFLTTALFNQIAREAPDAFQPLTHLLFGGEAVDPGAVAEILRHGGPRRLLHVYGPTENTTFSTWQWLTEVPDGAATLPIGKPIANSTLYLLDRFGEPVPVGVPGELYVGGDGLAQGYLNQPGLTEERFVADPFNGQPGAKLYRTGDIGRYLDDGSVEFIGRVDNQVKIRGFRVELGEIEAALAAHPAVREAAVSYADHRLSAYWVPVPGAGTESAELKAHLAQTLPEYMLPSTFVMLERMPLNTNGKIDRKRLPKPEREAERPASGAKTPVEEIVAGIWAKVLDRAEVGVDEDFFDLGGHSLLATQVISRLREAFGVELPLSLLFQSPTAAGLAREIDASLRQFHDAPTVIGRIGRDGPLALSFAQERLWFLDQLEPGNPFYNVPLALRLRGSLDIAALECAITALTARHELLRTSFPAVDGKPVQAIAESLNLPLPITDLSGLQGDAQQQEAARLMAEEAKTPFDLAQGPLLQPKLLRLSDGEHLLLFTMHHIIADGWSLGVLVNELVPRYAAASCGTAASLPELPVQYADFAAWQRGWLAGPVLENQLAYWKRQLAGVAPALELPTDRPRPPTQSYQGSSVHFQIGADTASALRRLSRDHGATLFMALLAAFATLLHRYSRRDDIVIGSPIANRNRVEIEPLIGFFVNTLAMRVDLAGNPSFIELLGRVRKTALEAYAHQDLPFEKLVDEIQPERDLSLNPLFQVMFALQNAPLKQLELPGLEAELLENQHLVALFDLVLDLWESGDGLACVLEYNTDLFDEASVWRIVGHFSTLLDAIAAKPDSPLDELQWLTEAERQWLLKTGDGPRRDYPTDQTIHALFERVATQYPANVAATHRGVSIHYADLDARANRIAQHLRRHDVGPGDFVGILDERGIDLLASMLGILKAGAAFVPLDPAYPAERIQYMLADSQIKVLISRRARLAELPAGAFGGNSLLLDDDAWTREPASPVTALACSSDLAYMLYTSGSTGLPKGAMLRHDGAVNHIFAEFELLGFHPGTAFLQSAPSSSDISVWQFLAPVLIGGRTVIADYETVCDPAALLRLIQSERVSLVELVPVVLREWLDHANTLSAEARAVPNLAWAMVTGEAATPSLVNLWLKTYPGIKLVNAYGPTEAADDISQAVLSEPLASNRRNVPIGLPLPNLSLYVLDQNLRLVPAGVPGEICVSGIGVGAGYFGQPEKTQESFVPNPFADGGRGEVLYRTGDLGRWLPDGNLECLERIDHQVKLRGFRIELGEIEGVLSAHPAVREAAVVIRDDPSGEKQLLGYVVPDTDAAEVRALAEALQRQQVDLWQDLHEDSYQDELLHGDATFNVIGWDSNYTNAPLPEADMREYVGFTVDRIRSLNPRRVLELGCGTGLIMFPLLPYCEAYTGTDLSQVTVRRLESLRQSPQLQSRIPKLADAKLLHKRADDCAWIEAGAFDTVVMASVVQYFPGIDYLLQLLDGVFGNALADGGSVFIGDVRSLPLLEAFTASVQLYKASDGELTADLAEKTRLHLAQEQEMAIEPGFFVALRQRYPQISAVEILPKRGFHHNEMTRFRYDVLIRTGASLPVPQAVWADWRESQPGLQALRQRLEQRPVLLAWQRVQNLRVRQDMAAAEWLLQGSRHKTAGELKAALAGLSWPGLEPEDLWRLGEETGYRVDLSFAAGHADGSFDMVFRPQADDLPPAPLPTSTEPKPWRRYANNPLHEKLARQLTPLLRESLKARLPHYMVPAHYVLLPNLPLTPAGKVDRLALPTPALAAKVSDHAPPRNREEQVLAAIWADVLGLDQVGIDDNFFELGGHSLKATQVTSRIHRDLGVPLALRELFNHPTVAELAECVRDAKREAYRAIPKALDAPHYPLSHAQRRLWVLSQMDGGSVAYNMPMALLLEGPVDVAAMQGALDCVVARHESLRTAFILVDDKPRQTIAPQVQAKLSYRDLSATQAAVAFGVNEPAAAFAADPETLARHLATQDAETPFELGQAGLFRASLLKLSDDRHVLLFNMHHIISDGWSGGVLVREFTQGYAALVRGEAPDLPPLTLQYRDYACWQEAYLQTEAAHAARDYWHRKLAGTLPVLNLATDKLRPPVKTYRGRNFGFRLGDGPTAALAALGRAHHASLFIVLAAIVKALLYRHSGQADLLVGFPIAGRDHADLESQIGFYVNTLPLRDAVDGDAPFSTLLAQVKTTATEAYAHQAYPFDRLVDELEVVRDVSRSPMFDVVIVMQNAEEPGVGLEGLRIRPFITEYESSKFDLSFTFEERDGGLQVDLGYNSDLFVEARIQCLAGHFLELAGSVLADAQTPVNQLNMLSAAERKQVLGEAPCVYPPTQTLVGWFEAQAAQTPEHTALVFPETAAEVSPQETGPRQTLSYAELNACANRLARHLRQRGVGPGDLVGLCLPRSLDLAVGLLGILKAGAAYVPLDPAHPAERRVFMAADAGLKLLLTISRLGLAWPGLAVPVVDLDNEAAAIAQHGADNPPPAATPDALAYVIYTSGSTGKPKGVAVSHHNVVRLFRSTESLYRFNSRDVWTLFHSAAFDFSVWELWGALLYGGSLVIVPYWVSRSPQAFHKLLVQEHVTVLNQTPSAFRQLIQADADAPADEGLSLRHVVFGGEALDSRSLKPWFDRHGDQTPQLVNMYGITETTVHVTYRPLSAADLGVPGSLIGKPLADLRLYLLDQRQQPAAIGVTGELYVGGGGVAGGYLNRPELTAQRFIADPFADGGRLYRTGDLARFLPNGDIEYLGRIDQQVQIRGFRVELGEIEAALCQHSAVRDAIVLADEDGGATRLLAYLTPANAPAAPVLRQHLLGLLPDYMLPAAFIALERFPLTGNGKLDRAALPKPVARPADSAVYVPASAGLEQTIAGVFMQVLEASRVGIHDNFFELGANSLLLMQAHRKLQQALGRDFPVVLLFQHPTVAALAAHLGERPSADAADGLRVAQDRAAKQKAAQRKRKTP